MRAGIRMWRRESRCQGVRIFESRAIFRPGAFFFFLFFLFSSFPFFFKNVICSHRIPSCTGFTSTHRLRAVQCCQPPRPRSLSNQQIFLQIVCAFCLVFRQKQNVVSHKVAVRCAKRYARAASEGETTGAQGDS